MSGAWIAATQERTRFKRINGYGSKAFEAKIVLTTIHKISTPVNAKINAQLPANFVIASAAHCPRVYFSAVGLSAAKQENAQRQKVSGHFLTDTNS